ncbi:MAG: hypothetical protein ACXWF4_08150, partial [Candidatus Aminicenantales bacterium]
MQVEIRDGVKADPGERDDAAEGERPSLRVPPLPPGQIGGDGEIEDDAYEEDGAGEAELGDVFEVIVVGVDKLQLGRAGLFLRAVGRGEGAQAGAEDREIPD